MGVKSVLTPLTMTCARYLFPLERSAAAYFGLRERLRDRPVRKNSNKEVVSLRGLRGSTSFIVTVLSSLAELTSLLVGGLLFDCYCYFYCYGVC